MIYRTLKTVCRTARYRNSQTLLIACSSGVKSNKLKAFCKDGVKARFVHDRIYRQLLQYKLVDQILSWPFQRLDTDFTQYSIDYNDGLNSHNPSQIHARQNNKLQSTWERGIVRAVKRAVPSGNIGHTVQRIIRWFIITIISPKS